MHKWPIKVEIKIVHDIRDTLCVATGGNSASKNTTLVDIVKILLVH